MMFFRSIFLSNLICVFLCSGIVSAGSIEDIRAKIGWEPAEHSDRETAYCPFVTPAELIAHRNKYYRDKIKMQVLCHQITTRGLDVWIGPKRRRHKWSSKKYVSFIVKDPLKRVSSSDMYLFLNKNNPYKETLMDLGQGEKITVTGFVKDIDSGKVWIDVSRIDTGWSK